MKAVQAFKGAVLAALLQDAGVQTIAHARVYDTAPQPAVFPYIYMGPVGSRREPTECGGFVAWILTMRLYGASKAPGRDEAWTIIAAMDAALDGQMLTMPDGVAQVVAIQTVQGGDVVSPVAPTQTFLDITATVAG